MQGTGRSVERFVEDTRMAGRRPRSRGAFDCPQCGERVPAGRRSCPACGADERTGWSEEAELYGADEPTGYADDEFDYEQFVEEEFGRPAPRTLGMPRWLFYLLLLAALATMVFLAI